MTYILAWKDEHNIYITGDTAITSNVGCKTLEEANEAISITRDASAFGEKTVKRVESIAPNEPIRGNYKKTVIQEKCVKIQNIDDKIIVGYAGSALHAVKVVKDIIEHIRETPCNYTIRDIIRFAAGCNDITATSFVFGFFEDGKPQLVEVDSSGLKDKNVVKLGMLSVREDLPDLSDNFASFGFENHTASAEKLIQVCSVLQSFFIRNEAMRDGVGGLYTGAYLSKDGFYWREDTIYVTFSMSSVTLGTNDPEVLFLRSKLVGVFHRDDQVLRVFFNKKKRKYTIDMLGNYDFLRSTIATQNCKKYIWGRKYWADINGQIEKFNTPYYVFVCVTPNTPNKVSFVSRKSNANNKFWDIEWEWKWTYWEKKVKSPISRARKKVIRKKEARVPVFNIEECVVDEINPFRNSSEYKYTIHWIP